MNRVEIQNVACLLHTEFRLTKFHALIGPNDSGKSLILRTISSAGDRTPPTIAPGGPSSQISVKSPRGRFTLTRRNDGAWVEQLEGNNHGLRQELQSAIVVDFDPPQLRQVSALLPESEHVSFLRDRGAGLPGIYDSILNAGDQSFYRISTALAELFPAVRRLRLNAVSTWMKFITSSKRRSRERRSQGSTITSTIWCSPASSMRSTRRCAKWMCSTWMPRACWAFSPEGHSEEPTR